ncbi:unnamed protein product [Rhodiola kirilowii]
MPVKKLAASGFVPVERDLHPSEHEILLLTDTPSTGPTGTTTGQQNYSSASTAVTANDEPQPPQPFEYTS